jgi:adenylate kinase
MVSALTKLNDFKVGDKYFMSGKVLLVTGLPASGKTTLVQLLEKKVHPIRHVNFGRLILEVRQHTDPTATHDQLRASPTTTASVDYIQQARELLLQVVRNERDATNIVIDSHAVSADDYGFRVTPDSHSFLQELRLDAILILQVDYQELYSRLNKDKSGRRQVSLSRLQSYQSLQDSVAIAYSVVTGCPVFAIDANDTPSAVLDKTLKVFDAIGLAYNITGSK